MKTFTKTLVAGLAASAMLAGAATSAAVAMDLKGKTMKIVIPYGPGGTYDKYGVAFSNHLGKHIPGNPNIILQHMPGAGGAKAMNWFANVAPKDGMTMIVVTHEMGFAKRAANSVVFMDQGEIVESADTEKFFADPESDRTKLFLSQILGHA